MDSLCRDESGLSGRLWQEIDQTVSAVKTANGTARRFLPIDGPYGLGLTNVAGGEGWLPPGPLGPAPTSWNVPRHPAALSVGDTPYVTGPGTYLVQGDSRPVPLIASEFYLGMRAVEASEAGCQPLDLCAATAAARDVALEEERLLYYGNSTSADYLLRVTTSNQTVMYPTGTPPYYFLLGYLHLAIEALAQRGFAGPFALAAEPPLYTALYRPVIWNGPAVLMVDILRNLFRGGVFMVPVIDPGPDTPLYRVGAIVTVGRSYSRLVVGQDWVTAYRGRSGVLQRFIILNSLQLRICEPDSIQVLRVQPADAGRLDRYW
jgi:uncharacterized linocin/CFP29 family protein